MMIHLHLYVFTCKIRQFRGSNWVVTGRFALRSTFGSDRKRVFAADFSLYPDAILSQLMDGVHAKLTVSMDL